MTRILLLDIPKPDDLPFLNSNDRLNRFREAKLKARWRQEGLKAVEALPGNFIDCFMGRVLVTAHIWKPIENRYDPNNFWATTKPLMDGIVDSGLLIDDDWRHVRGPHHEHGGKGRARVVLRIEEER